MTNDIPELARLIFNCVDGAVLWETHKKRNDLWSFETLGYSLTVLFVAEWLYAREPIADSCDIHTSGAPPGLQFSRERRPACEWLRSRGSGSSVALYWLPAR